jgi:hypothetical protein
MRVFSVLQVLGEEDYDSVNSTPLGGEGLGEGGCIERFVKQTIYTICHHDALHDAPPQPSPIGKGGGSDTIGITKLKRLA